jgi:glucosamine--fructose-6-phosphate aminotransferase (isomerizing)
MCGISGLVLAEGSTVAPKVLQATARDLFKLSEARGKESPGLAVGNGGPIRVFKQPIPASVMVRSRPYKRLMQEVFRNGRAVTGPGAMIGHSRLVTNGFQENNENNQPVVVEGMVAVHNGIITNDEALWRRFPAMHRAYEVDAEVLLRMIHMRRDEGATLTDAVRSAFAEIQGYASVAVLFGDLDYLLLATNNGSLYSVSAPSPAR